MTDIFLLMPAQVLVLACVSAVFAGVVKGIVGFAMPMILISTLGSFLAPELALAGLILPTLVTNGWQALKQGARAAWASVKRFRVFLGCGLMMLVLSAQMVTVVPMSTMLLMIGVPVSLFAASQIAGKQLVLSSGRSTRTELVMGGIAGFIGGFSGVWGPPTVAYLTALGTEKREQMRVQGVIYGLGAIALAAAHAGSGILTAETFRFSAVLVIPAMMGMWIGGRIQSRIDQAMFRKLTLWVLLIAGLNLVRRAVMM